MNLDVSTTACLDINAVQRFKNWYFDRTGINLDLGESFNLCMRHQKGENVLALADQLREDRK